MNYVVQERRRWPLFGLIVVTLVLAMTSGCVRRRLTLRTDPPGATVYIDNREIGITPVSTAYTYYGTRNFVVTKDGYETIKASRTFDPPWYEYPPIDFIAENLWPFELRDERVVDFRLSPQQTVPTEKLRNRAEDLRLSASQGHAAPLPSCATNAVPPVPLESLPPSTLPPPELNLPPTNLQLQRPMSNQ